MLAVIGWAWPLRLIRLNIMKIRTIIGALLAIAVASRASAAFVERLVVVAPGVTLRSIEAGKATASPIVFIPGWSTGADIWRRQLEQFAAKHRVIAFDPRSQGESTKVMMGNTPEDRATDLHALLVAQHLKRPVLVGWSQAVQDIAAYALRYGTSDLAGIVLVDAAVSDGSKGIAERPKAASVQFGLFATYLSDQQAYLQGMFGAIISKPQPKEFIERVVVTGLKTPPSIGLSMLVSDMFTRDRTAALAKFECPVLIVAAGSSFELEQQRAEATVIKNARFVQIDDSAHAVFIDQPDRFASALSEFLGSLTHVVPSTSSEPPAPTPVHLRRPTAAPCSFGTCRTSR
jgi:microsomal epoxide hydrolase